MLFMPNVSQSLLHEDSEEEKKGLHALRLEKLNLLHIHLIHLANFMF